MNIKTESIKSVFTIRDKDWERLNWSLSPLTKLEKLISIIPESTFYYKYITFGDSGFKDQMKEFIKWAKNMKKHSHALYMIDDGENNMHAFAIKKEIKNLPLLLSKKVDIFGLDGMYEEFNVADLEIQVDET